jgi:hypothetical protein
MYWSAYKALKYGYLDPEHFVKKMETPPLGLSAF